MEGYVAEQLKAREQQSWWFLWLERALVLIDSFMVFQCFFLKLFGGVWW